MTVSEGRKISIHEAQIKTAEVRIKALTVGGRQVTLNVFRQLQNEPLVDRDTAEMLGVPWGRVNYFPKPCDPDHLHVVWQKGEELRRACVRENPHVGDWEDLIGDLVARWCHIATVRGWQPQHWNRSSLHRGVSVRVRFVELDEVLWTDKIGEACASVWAWRARLESGKAYSNEDGNRRETQRRIEWLIEDEHVPSDANPDELVAELGQETKELREYREKWARHYAEILALDQLFVAT